MRIALALVSEKPVARDLFVKEKEKLIPQTFRSQFSRNVGPATYVFTAAAPQEGDVQTFVHASAINADAIILLVDSSLGAIVEGIASACIVGAVNFRPQFEFRPIESYRKAVVSTLTKALSNLAIVITEMKSEASLRALLLPFRNFVADDLDDLRALVQRAGIVEAFQRDLKRIIGRLNSRRRPRRRSGHNSKYIVDDDSKLFEFGKERHARFATGGSHTSTCELHGLFRFGGRVPESARHYNVTKEDGARTKVFGVFPNCHEEHVSVSERTHLNIFTNDYFE